MTVRGLTLIELVLTIALAGILAVPTGLLLTEHLREAMSSRDSTFALQLARAEVERLESFNNFFKSPELNIGSTLMPNYQGYPYDVTRAVTCQVGNCVSAALNSQGVKRIDIVVTQAGSLQPQARLISYRTKHVSFGL